MSVPLNVEKIQQQFKEIGLDGWLEDWDVKNIFEQVSRLEPGDIYWEVGVAFGKSMAVAVLAAKPGVLIGGVDRLNWKQRDENIVKFLEMNGVDPKTKTWTFVEGDSQEIASSWNKDDISVLFIDGDHTYEGVKKDWYSWEPSVRRPGVIMFDDYHERTGVKKFIDENIELFKPNHIDGENYWYIK